jgi:hypothetical protein
MASAASTRASAHSSWAFPSCAKDISVTPWPTCQSQHTTVAAAMRQAFLQADAKTASVGRLKKRVKRRADVIGIFQNEASITPHKRRPCFSAKM